MHAHHESMIPALARVCVVVLLNQSYVARREKFSDVKSAQRNLLRARRQDKRLNAFAHLRYRELEPEHLLIEQLHIFQQVLFRKLEHLIDQSLVRFWLHQWVVFQEHLAHDIVEVFQHHSLLRILEYVHVSSLDKLQFWRTFVGNLVGDGLAAYAAKYALRQATE